MEVRDEFIPCIEIVASKCYILAAQKLRICYKAGCKIFAWVDPEGVINIHQDHVSDEDVVAFNEM